jgi:hypothetical protein
MPSPTTPLPTSRRCGSRLAGPAAALAASALLIACGGGASAPAPAGSPPDASLVAPGTGPSGGDAGAPLPAGPGESATATAGAGSTPAPGPVTGSTPGTTSGGSVGPAPSPAPAPGSAPPPSPDGTAPLPVASTGFLPLGLATQPAAAGQATTVRLAVVDPAAPGAPRLNSDLGPDAADRFVVTRRWTVDAPTRTHTLVAEPQAFFVEGGRLWRISLAAAGPTVPQPAAPEADVCAVGRAVELDLADGLDAWVETERSGPDGDCRAAADNRRRWVRPATGESATLPDGTTIVDALRDASGRLLHLLAHDAAAARLELRTAASMAAGPAIGPSIGAVVQAEPFAEDPASPQARYLRVNGDRLRRLTWTDAGAQLGDDVHVFATGGTSRGVADGRAMYFGDGPAVWRLAPGNPLPALHTLLPTADGPVSAIDRLGDQLLVSQGWPRPALHLVPTAVASPVVRLAGGAADARVFGFVGGDGGAVLYTATPAAGGPAVSPAGSHALFRVPPGGTAGIAGPANMALAGVVQAREQRFGTGTAVAVLLCPLAPSAPAADCAGRELQRLDVASGAVTVLGTFPRPTRPARLVVTASAWAGLPTLLSGRWIDEPAGATGPAVDLWLSAAVGAPGLVRVTQVTP